MKDPITIIGAGIGGLTTALTLKKQNLPFAVYERAAEFKPVGAGIILANNAMQVMQKLGLQAKLEKAGNRISAMKITDSRLRPLSVVDLSRFEQKYQVTNIAIHRGDLQNILAAEVGLENITFSRQLVRVENETPYTLTFADNSTLQAATLIGADGIQSVVRNQLFKDTIIRQANQVCWRGAGEIELPVKYHHELNEAWGKGRRFGFVKISARKVYWYALANATQYAGKTVDLEEVFHDFHPDILAIIRASRQDRVITAEITDLVPIHQWQAGNACLVGDAAHAATPNLGQGACQAIEDAYVLGQCLKEGAGVQAAFHSYEQKRIRKAHALVNASWQIGKMAHLENSFAAWLRNTLMHYTPPFVQRRQLEKIFKLDY